jgi:capping protein beta
VCVCVCVCVGSSIDICACVCVCGSFTCEISPTLSLSVCSYEGQKPSAELRELEIKANEVFDVYRDLYYEGGVASVYAWDLDDGFALVVLVKKVADGTGKRGTKGSWDSIHVIEVTEKASTKEATYKLTSTIMLSLTTATPSAGDVTLSGSMTRQSEQTHSIDTAIKSTPHIVNIGKMVEEMETKMRMQLESIYFGKTKDIISTELRTTAGVSAMDARRGLAAAAMMEMQRKQRG